VRELPERLEAGEVIGGRYRLERRLGAGGMAAVWLATDDRLGRPVAVKALSEVMGEDGEYRQRFRREAKLAARIQHPNLVGVYDYRAGERPYLVMEYIEGGTLAERLAAGNAPPVERLARELLSALRCIHSAGVLHRDVKPQNVLVDPSGRAHLTDFGIAETRDATSITRTGLVIGTERYMAPERRRGEAASERSDLYALGVLLAQVAEADGAGAATWELIERLRAEDPWERPASAAAALAELEGSRALVPGEPTTELAPADMPPPTEPVEASPDPAAPDRRRQLAVAGIVAAVVAVLIGVGLALGGGDDGGEGQGTRAQARDGSEQPASPDNANASPAESGGGGESTAETAGADGATLNDQGYALIQAGSYEEAIPVLQRAVDALAGSGDELTYNYALFNLAHALRLAGRPEEAIPLLEERLDYPDQQDVVAAELAAAREEAGLEPSQDEDTGGTALEDDEKGGPPAHATANGHDK
jgi:tetratricopeptide (TPR) repeat protein/predicted Ser/Thr protein kinase